MHGVRTPREEIAFTAWPEIQSQSQIVRYGQSIFYLSHRPKFSDFFDLCLNWVFIYPNIHFWNMNSSVWAELAVRKKSGFEVFKATFEGGFFNFLCLLLFSFHVMILRPEFYGNGCVFHRAIHDFLDIFYVS